MRDAPLRHAQKPKAINWRLISYNKRSGERTIHAAAPTPDGFIEKVVSIGTGDESFEIQFKHSSAELWTALRLVDNSELDFRRRLEEMDGLIKEMRTIQQPDTELNIEQLQKRAIETALKKFKSRKEAAGALGVSETTLYRKMTEYELT